MEEAGENTSVITTQGIKSIFETLVFNTDLKTSGSDTRYALVKPADIETDRRRLQDMFAEKYPQDITPSLNEGGDQFCWRVTNKVLANTEAWEAFITGPSSYTIFP